ncbi:MAG: porin family protein [Flavobacteriaceae bacterium]
MFNKFYFLLVLIAFTTVNTNAQTYYGLKVGLNASTFYGDVDNKTIKPSMHFGAVAEFTLTDAFSVQPELLFSMQGYQKKGESIIKHHYHYVTAPIMMKYFLTNEITLDFGPQFGYLIFAQSSDGEYEYEELKETTSVFDYGIAVGASYEIDDGMNINLRYYQGIANVLDTPDDLRASNGVIQLSLGYKFY